MKVMEQWYDLVELLRQTCDLAVGNRQQLNPCHARQGRVAVVSCDEGFQVVAECNVLCLCR